MRLITWMPAGLLAVGALFTVGIDTQRSLPLQRQLSEVIPTEIAGFTASEVEVSEAELRVAGVSAHLMRNYEPVRNEAGEWFSLYIGYYDRQTQGSTIHSPKNCLPGGGWEPLASRREVLETPDGPVPVNRYLLRKGDSYAMVLYWYQGRGRIEANEYTVKWDLLRDAALRQRSEEALVRIVVPVAKGEEAAFERGASVAREVIPMVYRALPAD